MPACEGSRSLIKSQKSRKVVQSLSITAEERYIPQGSTNHMEGDSFSSLPEQAPICRPIPMEALLFYFNDVTNTSLRIPFALFYAH
jgi:hypothetical protein